MQSTWSCRLGLGSGEARPPLFEEAQRFPKGNRGGVAATLVDVLPTAPWTRSSLAGSVARPWPTSSTHLYYDVVLWAVRTLHDAQVVTLC